MVIKISGYPITTRFGEIDEVHAIGHKGVDIGTPLNTPVQSIGDGTVTQISDEGSQSFGKSIHIHQDNGQDVLYGHLSQYKVQVGQHVHTSDVIGLSGSSGQSTGPHLHIQITDSYGKLIDPTPYVSEPKDYIQKFFEGLGIPHSWFDTDHQGFTQILADDITHAIGSVFKAIFIQVLHFSPYIMLVVCMGSIMGMMIGSNRCKHWAGVSGMAAVILKVVDRCIPS